MCNLPAYSGPLPPLASAFRFARLVGLARSGARSAGKAAEGERLSRRRALAEWRAVESARSASRLAAAEVVAAGLLELGREAARRLEAPGGLEGMKRIPEPALRRIIDASLWGQYIGERLSAELAETARRGHTFGVLRAAGEVQAGDFRPSPSTRRALEDSISKIQHESAAETSRRLGREIEAGLVRGESPSEIAGRVRGLFENMSATRALTIATTSTTAAFEAGQSDGFAAAGVDRSRWLSQRDGVVRPSHIEADGQERALGVAFMVGGAALLHPGDPSGPPGEIINCRCTTLPILAEKGLLGALIRPEFNDAERRRIERAAERSSLDVAARQLYAALRPEMGSTGALEEVAARLFVSTSIVRRAVWPGRG